MTSVKCQDYRVKLIDYTSSDNISLHLHTMPGRILPRMIAMKIRLSSVLLGQGLFLDLYTWVQNLTP